ncbi:unnamed protein product [Didymodactylos carnosus]|uniref:Plus3 domain-containing protein n=1 Tax=Didymodactylos carnosus TaxID=1234261 RepID=A0A8S2HMV5_9BILA|nr:unnamed protein product [Didymodactylos carnosus]CAF3642183.1 unnamed protein product [Didymodactylos carnosus]
MFQLIYQVIIYQLVIIKSINAVAGRCYLCYENTLAECSGNSDFLQWYTEPCNGQCVFFQENNTVVRGCSWTYGHMSKKIGWHQLNKETTAYFCDSNLCNSGTYAELLTKRFLSENPSLVENNNNNIQFDINPGAIQSRKVKMCYTCTADMPGCGEFMNVQNLKVNVEPCSSSCVIFRNPLDNNLLHRGCATKWSYIQAKNGFHKFLGTDAFFCEESLEEFVMHNERFILTVMVSKIVVYYVTGIFQNKPQIMFTFPPIYPTSTTTEQPVISVPDDETEINENENNWTTNNIDQIDAPLEHFFTQQTTNTSIIPVTTTTIISSTASEDQFEPKLTWWDRESEEIKEVGDNTYYYYQINNFNNNQTIFNDVDLLNPSNNQIIPIINDNSSTLETVVSKLQDSIEDDDDGDWSLFTTSTPKSLTAQFGHLLEIDEIKNNSDGNVFILYDDNDPYYNLSNVDEEENELSIVLSTTTPLDTLSHFDNVSTTTPIDIMSLSKDSTKQDIDPFEFTNVIPEENEQKQSSLNYPNFLWMLSLANHSSLLSNNTLSRDPKGKIQSNLRNQRHRLSTTTTVPPKQFYPTLKWLNIKPPIVLSSELKNKTKKNNQQSTSTTIKTKYHFRSTTQKTQTTKKKYHYCENKSCLHGGKLNADCLCLCLPAYGGENFHCEEQPTECFYLIGFQNHSSTKSDPRKRARTTSGDTHDFDNDQPKSKKVFSDGLDESLIGDAADRNWLTTLSEREREAELAKRHEQREILNRREEISKRLKLKAGDTNVISEEEGEIEDDEDTQNNDGEDGENLSDERRSKHSDYRRRNEDNTHDDSSNSSTEDTRTKSTLKSYDKKPIAMNDDIYADDEDDRPTNRRLVNITKQKETQHRKLLQRLQEDRERKRKNEEKLKNPSSKSNVYLSDSSDNEEEGRNENKKSGVILKANEVFSSSDEDNDDARSDDERKNNRLRRRSRSSSETETLEKESKRKRSTFISTAEDLTKMKLSRFKMEKWCHAPFFPAVARGAFVRINIGQNAGNPVYRIGEILDVVETAKVYQLGNTRTNKGLRLKHGSNERVFRLEYVSNSQISDQEFKRWRETLIKQGIKLPTMEDVENKQKTIQKYNNYSLNEKDIDKMVQEKQRFRKTPINYAVKKSLLLKDKLRRNKR